MWQHESAYPLQNPLVTVYEGKLRTLKLEERDGMY
jgi:hypothetical protein